MRYLCTNIHKGKGDDVVPVHTMRAHKGSGRIAPPSLKTSVLDEASGCGCFTLQVPLKGTLGEPQSQSGHLREEENLLPLPGIIPQTVQPTP